MIRRNYKPFLSYLSSIALVFLSSCQPHFEKTESIEKMDVEVQDGVDWLSGNWWEIFGDSKLNLLVEQSLRDHPSMEIARDRIKLALWSAKEVRALLFPILDFNTDSIKTIQSKTGIFGPLPPPAIDAFPRNYTQTEFNLDLVYEFDFWEKNKNEWRAAIGDVQVKKAEELVSKLVLSLSLVDAYFKLQTDLIRKEIAEEFFQNRKEVVRLTDLSLKQNLSTNQIKLMRQNDLLYGEQYNIEVDFDVAVDRHFITALLAQESQIDVKEFLTSFESLESLIHELSESFLTTLPLDLIAYRPDIQAMLWRIRSYGFRIKAAEALFYPNINLSALTGFQTIHLPKLFNGESLYGMWGPALHLPIFDGGALKANLGIKKTEYKLAVDGYREALLNATRQVLDAKDNCLQNFEKLKRAKEISTKTKEITRLIEQKLRANLASNIDLLEAKADLLNAMDNEVKLQMVTFQSILNLVRALGGGYN